MNIYYFQLKKQKQITLGIPLGEVCPACEIVPYCGDATAGSAVLNILDFLWKLFPMIRVGSQITHRGIEVCIHVLFACSISIISSPDVSIR
ncbi:hypothetical protein BT93_L5230 [Corymbia citriodora subsp. variegata]|uniref:Uncharacterized protein n=1 Tax=Corymbia citriodora subsp. variegata TaxID=360336 RepID=A0A8T0CF66_CORYI|nr:hypothetical protein BT93_L5230 [Corymbia citriodora subsp. variegata]